METNHAWFVRRAWSMSANRVLLPEDGSPANPVTTLAATIHHPRSAEEIARIVAALPPTTPIACVSGGHESSNAALVADDGAVILDLVHLKDIAFDRIGEDAVVTVGSGVVFRELVEAVHAHGGALPVGTGPGVGVVGYVVNGGLSSYFSRRLGLLGQRVLRMTVVTAAGEIRVLTPGDPLFTAMLGAGSALGIVVDVTFRLAPGDAIAAAEQRVFGFATREEAVRYARVATRYLRDRVLPDSSVSLELVVTGGGAIVTTAIMYDTFTGDASAFVDPLETMAAEIGLPTLASARWSTWYEAAAALWPVIAGQTGNPLAFLCHCMGTEAAPTDAVVDYVCDTVVGEAPLDAAPLSIIEIRSLGGAILDGPEIPTGNRHHGFFVDLVTLYDAAGQDGAARQAIVDRTNDVVARAHAVPGLAVDFSGTHTQPDDVARRVSAARIFGTPAMAERVRALKAEVDPHDRFRFHPFANLEP